MEPSTRPTRTATARAARLGTAASRRFRPPVARVAAFAVATVLAAVGAVSCGDDDDAGEPAGTAVDTAPGAVADPVLPTGGIRTVETSIGEVLATAEGLTLYIFTPDPPGESTCVDECAITWPPAVGEPITIDGIELTTIERPDGTTQLAIGDRPLYTYAADTGPGDVYGQAVGDIWFAVGADGEPIS